MAETISTLALTERLQNRYMREAAEQAAKAAEAGAMYISQGHYAWAGEKYAEAAKLAERAASHQQLRDSSIAQANDLRAAEAAQREQAAAEAEERMAARAAARAAGPRKGHLQVTLPDGTTDSRRTERAYTHVLAQQRTDGTWRAFSWHGSAELARKASANKYLDRNRAAGEHFAVVPIAN